MARTYSAEDKELIKGIVDGHKDRNNGQVVWEAAADEISLKLNREIKPGAVKKCYQRLMRPKSVVKRSQRTGDKTLGRNGKMDRKSFGSKPAHADSSFIKRQED